MRAVAQFVSLAARCLFVAACLVSVAAFAALCAWSFYVAPWGRP